jgi:hypothetical protein
MKTPQEMSRLEIGELERELRELDDPVDENVPREVLKSHPEYIAYKSQLEALIPIRLGIIKRYWEKNKMQKRKREEILAAAEESEAFLKDILEEKYVHFTEAIPEIGEFLVELDSKAAVKQELLSER